MLCCYGNWEVRIEDQNQEQTSLSSAELDHGASVTRVDSFSSERFCRGKRVSFVFQPNFLCC